MNHEDEIRVIAYRIWVEEGCPDGRHADHWFMAETIWREQYRQEAIPASIKAKPRKAKSSTKRKPSAKKKSATSAPKRFTSAAKRSSGQ